GRKLTANGRMTMTTDAQPRTSTIDRLQPKTAGRTSDKQNQPRRPYLGRKLTANGRMTMTTDAQPRTSTIDRLQPKTAG
ncbi:hypothetical protein ACNQUF_12710, partial [Corynebacterium diphtheriae]